MKIIDTKKTSQEEIIFESIKVLKKGGLIIFPTETTYGAGVDATNANAVQKLLAYKSRREGKPLSIVVKDKKMASEYIYLNEQAEILYDQFLPGPVTIVCKNKGGVTTKGEKTTGVAPGVASEFNTLGIRVPDYPLIISLVEKFGKPITATSANASGKKRPYTIEDIFNNLSDKQNNLIDLVLDAGKLPKNEPSTVIDTTLSTPVKLRDNSHLNSESKTSNDTGPNNEILNLESSSEQETKEIAGRLLLKNWNQVNKSGIIFALDGDLGVGKTIFTKGIAEFINISETIKSPTYSYIEEYDFKRHQTSGKLFHLDMWKVENQEMFDRLEIGSLIGKNNVIVIEWFDQVKDYFSNQIKNLKIIKVKISEPSKSPDSDLVNQKRTLTIQNE